jgi:hypothetical protein
MRKMVMMNISVVGFVLAVVMITGCAAPILKMKRERGLAAGRGHG